MQGLAATLNGKELDSLYFELYFESLYLLAQFLDEGTTRRMASIPPAGCMCQRKPASNDVE